MNNHKNTIFHQLDYFLKTPLALLGVDLKNIQFNKTCHFSNHPYLCKALNRFLAHYLNSNIIQKVFNIAIKGTVIPMVKTNDIAEQNKTVKIMSLLYQRASIERAKY